MRYQLPRGKAFEMTKELLRPLAVTAIVALSLNSTVVPTAQGFSSGSSFGGSYLGGFGKSEWVSPVGMIARVENGEIVMDRPLNEGDDVEQLVKYGHADNLTLLPSDIGSWGESYFPILDQKVLAGKMSLRFIRGCWVLRVCSTRRPPQLRFAYPAKLLPIGML